MSWPSAFLYATLTMLGVVIVTIYLDLLSLAILAQH